MIHNLSLPKQTPLFVFLGLLFFIFFTLTYAFWQWRSDWQIINKPIKTSPITLRVQENMPLIAELPEQHLFGQSFTNGQLPLSNLHLLVTGISKTLTDQKNSVSKAYISMANQPSKIYQIGDSLPYGVKVYAITADAVILENDGHLEKLPLPRERLQFKPLIKGGQLHVPRIYSQN